MSKKAIRTLRPVAAAVLAATTVFAPLAAQAEISGNISVVSKYVLRGITNDTDNSGAALQGGLDYEHASGFYAGWWGSSLGYPGEDVDAEFENDFYAGFAGEAGPISYDIGLVYYWYMDSDDLDAPELAASLGFGPVALGMNYLLDDVAWGNAGDTYLTLNYGAALPMDFSFDATLGYYIYEDSGEFIAASEESSAFRHLDLTLSHPLGNTGADMSVTYIVGGKDRSGESQGNTMVLALGYAF